MNTLSVFESRNGRVSCTPEQLYHFLEDMRNFERFIPKDKFNDITINSDSCSFNVSMMGTVSIRAGEKTRFSKVSWSGSALQVNEFSMAADFSDAGPGHSEVRLTLSAGLNPLLKMAASDTIGRFLDILIDEMEKFREWDDVREDIRIP